MSKLQISRLTGSAKSPRPSRKRTASTAKRPRQARPGAGVAAQAAPAIRDWAGWLDDLDDCCEVIEVVGGLLLACGDDVIDGTLARGAGHLIYRHIQRLKALRKQLEGVR